MKQAFVPHKFTPESNRLIALVEGVIVEYQAQGFSLTLRQVYYQMIARDLLPDSWASRDTGSKNNFRSYKRLGDLISNARNAGMLDWGAIEDRGREVVENTHWTSPGHIVRAAAQQFRVDHWEGQDNYVEVMVEKDALAGILEPVCREMDVRFTANKGYSSSSAMFEAGQRFLQAADEDKILYLLYLGDHDPSGMDMTYDVAGRVALYAEGADLEINRLALNYDQVQRWNPPPNPAKETDSRYAKYVDKYGDESWELDAIRPDDLANLVRDAIGELIDVDTMRDILSTEKRMRKELSDFASKYDGKERK